MRIGVPKETFPGEGRVAAAPSAARALVEAGHTVFVEQGAGAASGLGDDEYIRAGAEIAPTAEEIYDRAELVWKVMPVSRHEAGLVKQRVLDYAALSADDTVRAAMSEIAGRLAVEAASHALQRQNGGRGLLLGGVPGVEAASVVILGAGVAGRGAAGLAGAMGAVVRVLDVDVARLRGVAGAQTLVATPHSVERALSLADVVIAAVRGPDGGVPRVATRAHLALMLPGAVVVDLSCGAFESTPATTLDAPAEDVDGIVHIGVPNFPGAVPRTATIALSQASLPVVRRAIARGAET